MKQPMSKKAGVVLAATGAIVVGGAGIAMATSGDDDGTERSITGTALERASAAALEQTGEGTVTETEVGDEESYYEVEVTLENGDQVDVQLDRDFQVVDTEVDEDESEDDD